MPIQLSISLLASGRRESMARCLDSLKPLLMQVPSELIIVLTEENKEIYEIASMYTEQIISFAWRSDFSAARNVGLKAAKGEWFLYIDDDEWFEDVSEICSFFCSEEHRRFNSASYMARNYLNWDGLQYIDVHVLRMARIIPGLHFENPIHESLIPAKNPRKYFKAYVHHYGYAKNSNNVFSTKMARNIPLLLNEIGKDPSNVKNYIQIIQEFSAAKNWRKADEYCRKGRSICGRQTPDAYRNWLQVHLIDILYKKGVLAEAGKEALNILKNESPCELVRLVLYSKLILIHSSQNEAPADIIRLGIHFEQLLTYMDENFCLWEQQRYGDLNAQMVRDPNRLLSVRLSCTKAALELNDAEKASVFLELLPWDTEYLMKNYYPLLDEWKELYAPVLTKILMNFHLSSPYFILQKALEPQLPGKKNDLLCQCAKETQSAYLQLQIIRETIRIEAPLSFVAEKLDLETWKQCTAELMKCLSATDMDTTSRLSESLAEEFPLHGLWLKKLLLEKRLTHGQFLPSGLDGAFSEYCNTVIHFYKEQYQEGMFDISMNHCLPSDCQYAMHVSQALEKAERKEFLEAIRMLCDAVRYMPSMFGATNELIRLFKNKMNNPAENAVEEYHMLAVQLKAALRTLTEQGLYTDAMSVLTQLTALIPEDLELLRIRQKLIRSME